MIRLNNIDKYYYKNKSNELHIINNLNLTFENTGLTTILGPSGSGKSTLLHVIGGLDKAKGSIEYDDVCFDKICTNKMDLYRNSKVGYIFQNYHLLPNLTVYQNLKLQLDLIGVKDPIEVERRIDICLKIIGMEKYKRRNVTALSGGQQQRVAIARALVKGAKVIIADEPTGNLDSKNSIEVMNILKLLSKQCLIVLVTHDQRLATHYSDRIIKISDGKIIEDFKNANNESGLTYLKDTIYLDQYAKEVLTSDNHNVSLYSNTSDKLQLNIVIENNTIYLENKTDLVVKVLGEETNIVFEEHKPDDEFKEIEINDDLSFTNTSRLSFKQRMKYVLEVLKKTFLSFIFVNKKVFFMYTSFFMIGILFCFCISSINYCTAVDEDILKYYPASAVYVDAKNSKSDSKYGYLFEYNEVKEMFETQPSIKGIVDSMETSTFSFKYMANRKMTYEPEASCYAITEAIYGEKLNLKKNEVAISKCLADEMIEYFTPFGINSYETLLSSDMSGVFSNIYNGDIIIKEIIEYPNYAVLFSDEIYYSIYSTFYQGIKYRYLLEGEELLNLTSRETTSSLPKIYISRNLEEYISVQTMTYEVAGYFDSEDFEFVYLLKSDFNNVVLKNADVSATNIMPYYNADFELIEGKLPDELNQIIIPDVFRDIYAIGDAISFKDYNYEVVGYFSSIYPINTKYFYSNNETAVLRRLRTNFDNYVKIHDYIRLYTDDSDTLIEYFDSIGHPAYFLEEYALKNAEDSKLEEYYIALVISITISVVMIVFMFFMSRSKMMSNIYNIGVYRALGATKKNIYIDYLLDAIYLATFTVLAGFMLMLLFVNYASKYMPGLAISTTTVLIVIPAIYFFVILASLLPIYLLLRKTPIEILAKYDI